MKRNFIYLFLRSYLVVLLIPVVVILLGVAGEIYVVRGEIQNSNLQKVGHSIELIDNSVDVTEMLVTQCARAAAIKRAATLQQVDSSTIFQYKDAIDTLAQIIALQNLDFIDDMCIYFNKINYVAYEASFYRMKLFENYRESWGLTLQEWEQMTGRDVLKMQYVRSQDGNLYLIMPINVKAAAGNEGMVLARIDTSEFMKYFSFADVYGACTLYVMDAQQQLLYYADEDGERAQRLLSQHNYEELGAIPLKSARNGWSYYVLLPENVEANRLVGLCVTASIMGVLMILTSLLLSMHQARKMGGPLEKVFSMVDIKKEYERNTEQLGEIVTGIVHSNKELLQEIEENRPLLRKAFFHDLITLDVTSNKELQYLAENAGIRLEKGRFRVACVRLFANNDSQDVDEQTLETVKVILQNMQKHLEEMTAEDVWFYQRDYLSQLVVFAEEDFGRIWDYMEETWAWLRSVFSTESVWGVSSACNDVLNIWKYCEEAEMARGHCDTQHHIMEYCVEFEDKRQFYLPEVAQEKLMTSLKAGDMTAVDNLLEILKRENFINRKLTRNSFIRLNSKITNMLALFAEKDGQLNESIMKLNSNVVEQKEQAGEMWFTALQEACQKVCARIKREKSQQRNTLTKDIRQYIMEHYADPGLGLATISMEFRISEGYVSTLFKEHTDINFAEYVESVRLNKACEMLQQRTYTIEGIASAVGYNSVHSFRRAFKRVYGMSPREYVAG